MWQPGAVDVTTVTGLVAAAGALAVATGAGLWWRRRTGRVQAAPAAPGTAGSRARELLTGLGVEPDTAVTLLQFSSAFCAPCRATRLTCGQVADRHDGVRHVEVDAEHHLDAVRALGVWRTPTVFVIDGAGSIVARVTGQPTRGQLLETVTGLLPRSATAGSAC
jgi:thiol-disulfide isomerase/thioredoxin